MIGSLSEWSIIASEGSGRSAPMRILPGSGINSTTIAAVTDALLPKGIVEFHMSGGRWIESEATYRRPGMGMGVGGAGEWCVWKTDREEVEKVKRYLQKLEI
jgi:copper homeostasis protein